MLIKADTAGSLEAVLEALPQSDIDVVSASLGEITEADMLEARASGAVVVGFNVKLARVSKSWLHTKKLYTAPISIIYELLGEMKDVVTGMEELLCGSEYWATVDYCRVSLRKRPYCGHKSTPGQARKGGHGAVMRAEVEIGSARIKSIRQGKNEITKVEVGGECGVLLTKRLILRPKMI